MKECCVHTLEMWGLVKLKQTRNRTMHIPDPQCVYVKHDSMIHTLPDITCNTYEVSNHLLTVFVQCLYSILQYLSAVSLQHYSIAHHPMRRISMVSNPRIE